MDPGLAIRPLLEEKRDALPDWLPVLLGMLVLYVPTFHRLFTGLWATEEQAHGPIILLLALWLMYRQWPAMLARADGQPSATGWPVLGVGLLAYILGRSQGIVAFEIASFILLLAAVLMLKCGHGALRVQWFAFFFMAFMVPLPGPLVGMLTMPMKMAVSWATEHLMYAAGYPIARSGVILQVGQYQLLVADACAGLQTLLTLEALGLFYLNVVRHSSAFRNVALALLIIPISFTANVIRVITLSLVTYYLGDAAGQGFLHGFAGMVLFITALLLIIGVDAFLQWFVKWRNS
ncbi:exosortase B [Duganella sp. CF458]|uniref:exosortase B n=1 Tax=Duganella sp. CF458 TaxID=1884368 RepID=UPI0008EB528C|nr:exosortase B [Duganella sp. CF458]SFG51699.1 exosortase B [Duganella sp. CF458]